MSEAQQEVFENFKQWIVMNNITENPWFNDMFLLRFCRARKFDLDKIILMFSNYIEYRKTNGLDTIVTVSSFFHAHPDSRTSCSTRRSKCFHSTPEDTAESTKSEGLCTWRDLVLSTRQRSGTWSTKTTCGGLTTSHTKS